MSVNPESQHLKEDENDISIDQHDEDSVDELTDVKKKEKQSKRNLDLNYSAPNQLDNKEIQVKKVQNTIIMPQDLRKSDKTLILNMKTEACDKQTNLITKSTRPALPSWKHYEGNLDDDVYTITATDQTLPSSSLQITSIDGFFNRKRGRPPKNRFIEVYKHTHQKPQAIFTSFKLEKRELTETVSNCDDSNCNYAQSSGDTSKGCDSDNYYPLKYPGQKPPNENSTLRYNRCGRVNTTHSGDKTTRQHLLTTGEHEDFINNYNLALPAHSLDCSVRQTKSCLPRDEDRDNNARAISIAYDSGPQPKKIKLYETADDVTVIRAAGTFYPENCNNFNEKFSDGVKKKETTSTSSSNEVAENASLSDETPINAIDDLETSTSAFTMPAGCSSVLPQIYNVLQMQQQLLAYYQRMALMTPALSQLESTLGNTPSVAESTCSQSSTDLLNKKNLINIILNLQKQQPNQTSRINDPAIGSKTEARLRHIHKKSPTTNSRSQSVKPLFDVSYVPEQNVPERKFQLSKGRTPSGYLRFRFNEDCGYEKCGYRQHQSHFHCNRAYCQYSFCDRTRVVQHTARHERLDTLMGTDFQQYRATMICNYTNCPYSFSAKNDFNEIAHNRKSSHFHCLKCAFVCTDTNKVVAHRRLHTKMEFIRLAGFRKVSTKENCMMSGSVTQFKDVATVPSDQPGEEHVINETVTAHCPYALRHAHYHCLVCNFGVLSRSQLLAHRHRGSATSTFVPQQQPLERVEKNYS